MPWWQHRVPRYFKQRDQAAFSMHFNRTRPSKQLHWRQGSCVGRRPVLEVLSVLCFPVLNYCGLSHCYSRTYNRIWSPRFAASWLWKLVGEGSRHNWSVTSEEGLALRVGIHTCLDTSEVWHTWRFIVKVLSLIELCLRRVTVCFSKTSSELKRSRGIRLFN